MAEFPAPIFKKFDFFFGAVPFAMMCAAERVCEFIADLLRNPAGLRKPQMVGVAGLPAADKAGLLRYKS